MDDALVLQTYAPSETSIPNPTWSDVEGAIRRLDGQAASSELWLGTEMQEGLAVVGGPRRFLCWIQRNDTLGRESIATAIDPLARSGTVTVELSNGQVDEYPANKTVDLETVLRLAETFLRIRELNPDVTWDRQESGM